MAIEIGTAYVTIVPSARGFSAKLRAEVGGAAGAGGVGAAAGDDFSAGFMSKVGGISKGIGAALVGAVTAAGAFGLKVAAANETAAISFETLLGSADKAQAFMGQLKDFAAKTPFELPGLRTSASQLLAVGTNAKDVIPIMTTLGDATSAFGTGSEGIQRATRALTQMQQKGKVQASEMLQLAEAGVPAWEALASVLGVDIPTAQKMVTNGQVQANKVFQAIETAAGPALGRVKGMMDKQSASLTGMLSTFKDVMSQGLGEAMGPAVVQLKSALPDVTNVLSGALQSIAPQLGEVVGGFVAAIKGLLPAIAPVIGTVANILGSGLKAIAPILEQVGPIFGQMAAVIGDQLASSITIVAPLIIELAHGFAQLAPVMGFVGTTIGGALLDLARQVLPLLVPLVRGLAIVFYSLALAAKPLIEQLGQGLTYALVTLALAATRIVATLGPVLVDVFLALLPVVQQLLDRVPELADAFLEILPDLLGVIVAIVPLLPRLFDVLPGIADAFLRILWAVLPLVPQLAELAVSLAPLLAQLIELAVVVLSDKDVLDVLVPALLLFIGAMQAMEVIGPVVAAIGGFVSAIGGIITAAGAAEGVFATLGAIIAATPIGWVIGLVVLLGAALFLAYKKFQPFADAVDEIGRALAAAFGWAKDFAGALFSWDTEKLTAMLSELGNTIKTFFVETLPSFIAEQGPKLLASLWGWLTDALPQLLLKLGELIGGFTVWYYTVAIPWLVSNGLKLLGALLGWLADIVPKALGALGGLLAAIGVWVVEEAIPSLISKGLSLLATMLLWLALLPIEVPFWLGKFLIAIGDWVIFTAVPWLAEKVVELGKALIGFVAWALIEGPKKLEEFAGMLIGFILGLPDRMTTAAKDLFIGLVKAFIAAVNWIVRVWNDLKLSIGPVDILGQKVGPFELETPNLNEIPGIDHFALGGRPSMGRPSLVGERGAELFWPDSAGTIIPAAALAGAASGSSGGLSIGSLTVTGQERPAETAFTIRSELRWLSMAAGET